MVGMMGWQRKRRYDLVSDSGLFQFLASPKAISLDECLVWPCSDSLFALDLRITLKNDERTKTGVSHDIELLSTSPRPSRPSSIPVGVPRSLSSKKYVKQVLCPLTYQFLLLLLKGLQYSKNWLILILLRLMFCCILLTAFYTKVLRM